MFLFCSSFDIHAWHGILSHPSSLPELRLPSVWKRSISRNATHTGKRYVRWKQNIDFIQPEIPVTLTFVPKNTGVRLLCQPINFYLPLSFLFFNNMVSNQYGTYPGKNTSQCIYSKYTIYTLRIFSSYMVQGLQRIVFVLIFIEIHAHKPTMVYARIFNRLKTKNWRLNFSLVQANMSKGRRESCFKWISMCQLQIDQNFARYCEGGIFYFASGRQKSSPVQLPCRKRV